MLLPKRVSSMLVTRDLAAVSSLYEGLGFARVATDRPECVGYVAGETGVILVSREFARECWGDAADSLAERLVPYIYLAALGDRPDGTHLLADVRTTYGTHELVIETAMGPIVLAEMVPSA